MSAAATARRSGMTLAEVLVALLLFGILASFVVGVVNSVLNLWQAGERRGRGDLVFAAAAERLRADVLAAHTGPRGWMQLDEWQAEPEGGGHPAWRLQRLRFLADGAAFPEADASGRGAVEVAWLLVPEPDPTTRFTRLVRIVQPESAPRSLREEGWITDLARAGAGLVVLDGVLHASFGARETAGADPLPALRIESYAPYGFPLEIAFAVERVCGGPRRKPPVLDDPLTDEGGNLALRGAAPFAMPERVLIGREWLRLAGTWPRFQAIERGARGTLATPHERGVPVWLPELDACVAPLVAGGRRLP
jgi:prepilin-type N-terminal cleavage/methylation domain-containing protein